MTELSTLLDLVFIENMPKEAIDKIRARIREIEEGQHAAPVPVMRVPQTRTISQAQAMDEARALAPPEEAIVPAAARIPQKRIVGGEIASSSSSGLSGTRGPRKF